MATRVSTAARNAELAALSALCNGGQLCLYTGPQPATPEMPATGTLLATLKLASAAFRAPANAVLVSTVMEDDQSAAASGVAGWGRVYQADGKTTVFDGAVPAEIKLNSSQIVKGARVRCTGLSIALPA